MNFQNNNLELNEFNEENIRSPIPSISKILVNDEFEEFIKFKREILSDKTIDKDMKNIIIKSRKEMIFTLETKKKKNIEKDKRYGIVKFFIIKLKCNDFNLINIHQEYILKNIEDWVDGLIQNIKLESETIYILYELIDNIKKEYIYIDDEKIKKIFEPKNHDEYIEYIDMMEQIKLESIKEEKERKRKELEKKIFIEELEKKELENNNKKKSRQELLNIILINLNRLSIIDLNIKKLKEEIEIYLNNYIHLEKDNIILNEELSINFNKFLSSIRISKEKKDNIINLILIK